MEEILPLGRVETFVYPEGKRSNGRSPASSYREEEDEDTELALISTFVLITFSFVLELNLFFESEC